MSSFIFERDYASWLRHQPVLTRTNAIDRFGVGFAEFRRSLAVELTSKFREENRSLIGHLESFHFPSRAPVSCPSRREVDYSMQGDGRCPTLPGMAPHRVPGPREGDRNGYA